MRQSDLISQACLQMELFTLSLTLRLKFRAYTFHDSHYYSNRNKTESVLAPRIDVDRPDLRVR